MEDKLDETYCFFNDIIQNIIKDVTILLNTFPSKMLDSDPNKGLCELSIQLVIYQYLKKLFENNKDIKIEMEKMILSSYCDIIISNYKKSEFLIIELKYIRITYLTIIQSTYKLNMKYHEKIAWLKHSYEKIKGESNETILSMTTQSVISDTITGEKKIKKTTIKEFIEQTDDQVKEYCKKFKEVQWKNSKIYYISIIGIGFKLLNGNLCLF